MIHAHPDWTPDAAAKTEAMLARAKTTPLTRTINNALYWILLVIAIVGNFVVSVVLVPFLVSLKGTGLYFILFFIGLSFGLVFGFILHSLEDLKPRKHIMASVFIPAIAIINVAMMAILSNKLIMIMKLETPEHSPAIVGAVYVFGYVVPEILGHFLKRPKLISD